MNAPGQHYLEGRRIYIANAVMGEDRDSLLATAATVEDGIKIIGELSRLERACNLRRARILEIREVANRYPL